MEFEAFHAAHWAALAAAAIAVAAIVALRARLRGPRIGRAVKLAIVAVLIGSELSLQVSYAISDGWGIGALPFQLCSIMLWFSVALLLTGNRRLYEVTFFLGLLGAMQALLTPDLRESFPEFRYFHFFIAHIAIVSASVYMTAVERYRPTLGSAFRAVLWLNLLAVPAAIANWLAGTNFMFLARKPSGGSLLDLLGPWPWYLVQLEFVAVALCLALYGIVRAIDRIAGDPSHSEESV
ncbi:TIGR02206 family membrane protein [Cohnella thailandensis]|uniref:TIGR02206 family membrane protein n=1 Tax=Cohnella thailandensis TaxID=557557 RepID=A0A841SP13_9BACL|nr:TIGR02206 family membrane protein [Cohnella thailandensis]MBB6632519.1 TIGR02206 family membrane protein [Cohnella thailandensis]MBP1971811.1 putative integral membrane protein (TIGR02206 family) [Cohnella thailandensis]